MNLIRFVCFALGVCFFTCLERRQANYKTRLTTHLVLIGLGSILAALVFPLEPFLSVHWGLLNWFQVPEAIRLMVSLLWLDGVVYFQHRWFHHSKWLWRLHAVHHSDHAIDASTGFRFHPIEILISVCIKACAIALMGTNFFEFTCFQIWLNLGALFTHADLTLPEAWTRGLNYVFVTPSAHRIHHLNCEEMQVKNYGFGLIIWDRFFKTYEDYTRLPVRPEYGLASTPSFHANNIIELIMQPVEKW